MKKLKARALEELRLNIDVLKAYVMEGSNDIHIFFHRFSAKAWAFVDIGLLTITEVKPFLNAYAEVMA